MKLEVTMETKSVDTKWPPEEGNVWLSVADKRAGKKRKWK